MLWTASVHCHYRGHCGPCRGSRPFRERLQRDGWEIPEIDFACPWNENPPRPNIKLTCCKKPMVFIKDVNSVPREGWRYPSIEGSRETDLRVSSYGMLHNKIVQHYKVNGKTPPTVQEMDLWLCEHLKVHCFTDGREFRNNWSDQSTPIEWRPVPRDEWPLWAKALALISTDQDKGIGDVVERTIGPVASEAFKVWYKRLFAKSCECDHRKEKWNAAYPL